MTEKVYLLPVWDTIEAAWRKMKGSKGTLWAAYITVFFLMLACGIFFGIIIYLMPSLSWVIQMILIFFNLILSSGVLYIALRHVSDKPISFDMLFQVFKSPLLLRIIFFRIIESIIWLIFVLIFALSSFVYNLPIPFISIVSTLIGAIGIIGGFIVYYRIYPALAFVLDGNQGPWQAYQSAFEITRNNVLRLFAIHFIATIIFFISMIPVGIGVIWSIPFLYNLYGVVYRRLLLNMQPS